MKQPHDPLEHAWKCLKADSAELVDNPLLEKRLMNEMNIQKAVRPRWRKLAIAAGLILGFLVLGGGIAAAAGFNPFKTFVIMFSNDGQVTVMDENGNPVADGALKVDVQKSADGSQVIITAVPNQPGAEIKIEAQGQPK